MEETLQTHETTMGTKVALSFANIFKSAVETEIISKSKMKPSSGKGISMTFSPCGTHQERKQTNLFC